MRARAFAEREPLRERRWAQLALAEYRLGQQAAALDALRSCREHLAEELGIDPSPAVAELEVAILRQEPALAGPPASAPDDECPWPGLSPYGPEQTESFFGRDDDIVAALAVLDARGCLAVVGPSGIGKSSFIRAGVIAALRARNNSVQLITPQAHALDDGVDVVVLDQAEELFTLPDWQRGALLDALEGYPGSRVIAMRADHMTDAATHPALARLIGQGLFLLGGLSTAGLTAAVEQPAAQHGLLVEPGLVDLLLRDLDGEPAALPLFSHALAQTWSRREGRTLTVAGYRDTGGVRGAVARSAEGVYLATAVGDRNALRSLLLRLVTPGSDGEPRRARMPADQLTDLSHSGLVDALVEARLVTRDVDTLTLTHEALVDGWPRLREWLDEDIEGRRVFHHLAVAARAWDDLGRPDSELYRGVRLARAVAWAETEDLALSGTESDYLEAGQRLADAEAVALAAQIRRQKRTNRLLGGLLGGVAVLLVAAVAAGGLAAVQARRADQRSLDAVASAVGAKALATDDPQLALLLAAAAEQVSPTADTQRSLAAAIAARPLLARTASVPDSDHLGAVAVNRVAVYVADHHDIVRAFDSDLRPLAAYDAGDGHAATIDPPLAADDDVVVAAGAPGDRRPIRLLDPASLTELPTQLKDTPANAYIIDMSLSADGRRLVVVYSPATAEHPVVEDVNNHLRVWDLATGLPVGPPIEAGGRWSGAALSADGTTVFSSTPVSAYNVATGATLWTTHTFTWNNAMDLRGNVLASATAEFAGESPGVRLYDSRTGKVRRTLHGDLGSVQDITLSRDGRSVAASGTNGTAIVWDRASGQVAETLDTGGPPITGAAFSVSGGRLVLAKPLRQELQAWDLTRSEGFIRRIGFDQIPRYTNAQPRFSPDSTRLAIEGWTDNELEKPALTIFDLARQSLHRVPAIGKDWGEQAGAWSPAGDRYAAGYPGGWVQAIDAGSGRELNRRRVTDHGVVALSYAGPDRLAVATDDGWVLLLDAGTLQRVGTPMRLPEAIAGLAGFSNGHTILALGAGQGRKITWAHEGRTWYRLDLLTGKIVQTGRLTMRHGRVLTLSPDEQHAAFGGTDGQVEIVDLRSGHAIRPAVSDGAGDMDHLVFDASGDRLATGSQGRPLGLWDARTGTPLASSGLPEDEPVVDLAFGRDGRILAGSITGNVYVWDVSASAAVRYACKVAGRELSRQEWADAFGNVSYRRVCAGR